MQVGGTVQEAGTIHPRIRPNTRPAITAILVIVVVVALVVWVMLPATSEIGAEDAIPKAGTPWVTLYDDAGNAHLVHVRKGGAEAAPPWVRLYDDEGNVHLVQAP